jgi:hypothetical protein
LLDFLRADHNYGKAYFAAGSDWWKWRVDFPEFALRKGGSVSKVQAMINHPDMLSQYLMDFYNLEEIARMLDFTNKLNPETCEKTFGRVLIWHIKSHQNVDMLLSFCKKEMGSETYELALGKTILNEVKNETYGVETYAISNAKKIVPVCKRLIHQEAKENPNNALTYCKIFERLFPGQSMLLLEEIIPTLLANTALERVYELFENFKSKDIGRMLSNCNDSSRSKTLVWVFRRKNNPEEAQKDAAKYVKAACHNSDDANKLLNSATHEIHLENVVSLKRKLGLIKNQKK